MTKKIDTEALLDELNEARDKYQKLVAEKGQTLLKALFQEIFAACPKIERIAWQQYTPYFNDGDACEFGVCGRYFAVTGAKSDGQPIDFDDTAEYEWAEAFDIKASYWSEHKEDRDRIREAWGDATIEEIALVNKLNRKIDSLDDQIFLETFGDHAAVVATLNNKGEVVFEVTESSHD